MVKESVITAFMKYRSAFKTVSMSDGMINSLIICNIIFILISFIFICLLGVLYNRDIIACNTRQPLLGWKYRIISLGICILGCIIGILMTPNDIVSGCRGAMIAFCIIVVAVQFMYTFINKEMTD